MKSNRFTLIEMLAVVTIIGVLAGMFIPLSPEVLREDGKET